MQHYLKEATGNPTIDRENMYHVQFRQIAEEYIIGGGSYPEQYLGANGNIRTFHFSNYLVTDLDVDPTIKEGIINKLKNLADNGGYMGWTPENYPYAQGVTKFNG